MANLPTLLIVEDDDDLRLDMRNAFRDDFEVILASEGVGAIKLMIEQDVDIIITDYKMDVLGGLLWLKFLRKFCPILPVIVTSGFLSNSNQIEYPIFYKPFEYEEIKSKIYDLLEKSIPNQQ